MQHIPHPDSIAARFLGERLRIRVQRSCVATAAAVSPEQIRRVEIGDSLPGAGVLAALARLGGDVQYVLIGSHARSQAHGTAMHPADIAAALKRAGYSQKDVGDLCGVGRGVANAVIRGTGRSRTVERKVAELTGLSLAELWPARYSVDPTDRSPSLATHERLDHLEAAVSRIESQLQQLISQQTPTPDRSHTHAP